MEEKKVISSLPEFIQSAWETSGFTEFTAVQKDMISPALEGKDIIAEAPTGSGKTVAYLLPSLNKLKKDVKQAQLVIVVSSRELAMQTLNEVQTWTAGSGFTSAALIGGANVKRQQEKLKKKPAVIVGTPGRLIELVQSKKLKMHEVSTLVFDEADQLFAKEHLKEVDQLLTSVQRDCQKLILSATIPGRIEQLAQERLQKPKTIRIRMDKEQLDNMEHVYLVGERRDKTKLFQKLVAMDDFYGIAFCNDRNELQTYKERLEYKSKKAAVLEGETKKQEREAAMQKFRSREIPLLLATDVASRGLDLEGLTHVVQLDLANDVHQYVHRAGRTARAGNKGTVVSIVTEGEKERLLQIGETLNLNLEEKQLSYGKLV
ncbi:DEAD/DEAH box helicase [Alkalicoccus daliensis]|uniref:Superfamily II DNA and RNA helicase n=1 Tax=Alkalicoccus daliensis TaxID=745820 RepID=A0A1G9ZPT7_9BACI|nr:DEAD/DEAH box helicase [Alkalicoccus daliensis]SDN22606.1 Superfamily II DNA and RNA helicase [Alkalicoccus daliensis]